MSYLRTKATDKSPAKVTGGSTQISKGKGDTSLSMGGHTRTHGHANTGFHGHKQHGKHHASK